MLVPHPEQGDGSEMCAGRFTADEKPIGTELLDRVLEQPAGRSLAVVRTCGIRVLRCKAVVDTHDRDVAFVNDDFVQQIHHFGRAGHPRTTVDVQEDSLRLFGA